MQQVSSYKNELTNRVSVIVNNLIKTNSLYLVKLDPDEMIEMLLELLSRFTPEEFSTISEQELTSRINSILMLEAISGTLNDLPPQQIKLFDEAVEGK